MDNTLLVVDDEAEYAAFVRRVAEGCGYRVRTTDQADEFRQWIADWGPTHIVMDLAMPGADGIELLRFLGGRQNKARILIMSGFDTRVLEAARRLGLERGLDIVAALSKPIRARELREVLVAHRIDSVTADAVRKALDDHEIIPFFQPKVTMASMRPVGFEALARWRTATGALMPPESFIPAAESGGVIDLFSARILQQAITCVRQWTDAGLEAPQTAINLSAHNLRDEGLADQVEGVCAALGVRTANITLEITETVAMAEPVRALDILTRLRLKGFKLSIDDFGTGYSSLIQLLRMPFSELKIDRSFVKDCHQSREALTIVRAVIDLAHNLEMTVVAEGVANPRIIEILTGLGCDIAQGYAISRALPAEEVPQWVHDWQASHAA